MPLSAEQRAELGRLLERERAKLIRRLQRFGADRDDAEIGGFSQHMAEDASALTERETAYLLASEEGRRLVLVGQALDRLMRDPGSFGTCEQCSEEIVFARLEAVPYTRACIQCQREAEESGSGRGD
jgi:DnaK suppressor protein